MKNKKNKELLDKIRDMLAESDVCALSIQGKHQYAVMKWETYQTWNNRQNSEPKEEDGEEQSSKRPLPKKETSGLFDINDIPV